MILNIYQIFICWKSEYMVLGKKIESKFFRIVLRNSRGDENKMALTNKQKILRIRNRYMKTIDFFDRIINRQIRNINARKQIIKVLKRKKENFENRLTGIKESLDATDNINVFQEIDRTNIEELIIESSNIEDYLDYGYGFGYTNINDYFNALR